MKLHVHCMLVAATGELDFPVLGMWYGALKIFRAV